MMANFYSLVIDRALSPLRRTIPEFAGMKPGDRVIDVCCGTGDQATYYAKLGIEAYGIDFDSKMIAVAEGKRKRFCGRNLHFQEADATALPFKDEFFDYATISLALHEKPLEVQQKVISEMRRVVKKGGWLILTDFPVPAKRFYRFLESLVGGEHYANFKEYQSSGGLEHLAGSFSLDIENRGSAMGGGAMQLFKIRN
jgi:ubiquinone/menaquinone biosynthesis C-methylase UbiE